MYKSTFNWTDWNIRNVTKLFHKCSWNWHRLQEQKLGAETTTDVFKPAQNSSGFVHSSFRIDLSSAPTPGLHSYRKNNFTRPIKPGEQNKICHTNYIKWNVTTWRFSDQSFCLFRSGQVISLHRILQSIHGVGSLRISIYMTATAKLKVDFGSRIPSRAL